MPKSDIPFETLVSDLHGADWQKRCDAARLLGQSRDPRAVDALLPDLQDPDWKVRRNAAQALGALKDPRALEALLAALKDRVATVRERAAVALGRIKDAETIPALLEAVIEPNGHVNEGAYQAIRKFGEKAGPQLAEALIARPNIYLLELLAGSKYEAGVEVFLMLVGSGDPTMRRKALAALGELNDPRARDYLLAQLVDGDLETQTIAARALGQLRAAQAVPIMLDLLRSDDIFGPRAGLHQAITDALQLISGIKTDVEGAFPGKSPMTFGTSMGAASLPETMGLLGDENFKKLNELLANLENRAEKLGGEDPITAAVGKAISDETWKFGAMFADARDARGERVKVLIELLKSDSALARAAAALSLPWYADAQALEPLEAAMQDPDETVRRAAAWAQAALKKLLIQRG